MLGVPCHYDSRLPAQIRLFWFFSCTMFIIDNWRRLRYGTAVCTGSHTQKGNRPRKLEDLRLIGDWLNAFQITCVCHKGRAQKACRGRFCIRGTLTTQITCAVHNQSEYETEDLLQEPNSSRSRNYVSRQKTNWHIKHQGSPALMYVMWPAGP